MFRCMARPFHAKKGKYKGETTLMGDKYPVTKGGKLYCGRVYAAVAYGSKNKVLPNLMEHGLGQYVDICKSKKH